MQPRLSTSRKWTALPKELLEQIRSVFQGTFKEHLQGSKIEADGRIYPAEILVSVGFRASKSIKQSNFQVSVAYKKDKDNVVKMIHIAMDAVGALFEQLFSAEDDSEFPRLWEEIDFEGRPIFVQYSTENSELESEADKILGAAGEGLAQGDWDNDISPEAIKASLGIDPDEVAEDLAALDDDEEDESGKKPH